jgi:hypothetical protein
MAGLHSDLQLFTQGRFIRGIKVLDFLAEGWTLKGSGTDLDGRPFELSQPFQSTELRPVSGEARATSWLPSPPTSGSIQSARIEHAAGGLRRRWLTRCADVRLASL